VARLFLVDGSNHAFRAHFALPPRHTSDGFPTRVLYGFLLLLQKMLRTWQPDYVAVSFDIGETFRHTMFPDYKGHRPDMPEDLRQQWPLMPELIEAFGVRVLNVAGFEADDVLGTLAARYGGPDVEVFLVTGDKDFCQCVNDYVSVLDESKGTVTDVAGVVERWGVPPDKIIDLLGLMGDSSDNIPGVRKVGEKTALKLIQEFGSLEGALAAAAEGKVKGAVGQRLVEDADMARLSKVLATIELAVPLDVELADLAPRPMNEPVLRALFDKWEFGLAARKLLPDIDREDLAAVVVAETDAQVAAALAQRPLAIEATLAGDPQSPELAALTVCGPTGGSTWIDTTGPFGAAVRATLADGTVPKVGHNLKGLYKALGGAGLRGVVGDTALLDYLLASHRKNHSLEDQAARHLGQTLSAGRGAPDVAVAAAAESAAVIARLHERQDSKLEEGSRRVYEQIELPLVPVLARMERRGIRLDVARIGEVEVDIGRRLEEVEAECHKLAGRPFNLRSRHELRDMLFEELKLTGSKKVKDGWSTDSDVLEKLVDQHGLPGRVLEFRSLDKLRGTYLTKLPTYVAADGRIHSTFQQDVAATGRLSSIDPNLQNIPVRTFEGRRIRDCFVPDPGYVFLSADYSQVELRVLAHFTHDPVLMTGFAAGEDIHRRTAVEIFGVAPFAVTLAQRSAAKAINFGLLYGMSAFRLAGDLAVPQAEAQRYMDAYFARMPAVRGWIEQTKVEARASGQVETLLGRRRVIPEISAATFNERAAGEREAVNTRIQGTAADIIKIAMIRVQAALDASGSGARLLLQVHDELLLEVPEAEVEAVTALVRAEMEAAGELVVPLVVNTSVGHTWNEAHG
jgi:DNA polymerase-1